MKQGKYWIAFFMLLSPALFSCSKNNEAAQIPVGITGAWVLDSVYANDHWGGPLYWQPAKTDTRIKFTTDGKYYRKYPSDTTYTYIGTYLKLTDGTLKITQSHPIDTSYPTYTLQYSLEPGGFIILGIYGFEGVVREKFRLQDQSHL